MRCCILQMVIFVFLCVSPIHAAEKVPISEARKTEVIAAYSNWLIQTGLSQPAEGWKLEVKGINKVEGQKGDQERITLIIGFSHPGEDWHGVPNGWRDLNSQFIASTGLSLNERLLFKLSHLLGVPNDIVQIELTTYCLWMTIKAIKGKTFAGVKMCKMVGSSTLISKKLEKNVINSLSKLPEPTVTNVKIDSQDILKFFKQFSSQKGAAIHIVAIEDHYVEVSLSKLRGEVIKEKKYWELLQSSLIIADRGESVELRLILDGQFAPGLKTPPLSGYIDMEPTHSKSLQLYAGELLASLKEFLSNK